MKIWLKESPEPSVSDFFCETLSAELVKEAPSELFFLIYEDHKLKLKKNESKDLGIFVDFEEIEERFKKQKISAKTDLLGKAIGCKSGLRVCDMTLGLGGDAARLVHFGATVTGFEEQPLTWALVMDGLRRKMQRAESSTAPVGHRAPSYNLYVRCGSSFDHLPSLLEDFDVFYLDPMYAHERSALPRKEMQYLAQITAPTDELSVLKALEMLRAHKKKTVIKRAPQASFIGDCKPLRSVEGKMVRFDIY